MSTKVIYQVRELRQDKESYFLQVPVHIAQIAFWLQG